MLPETEPIYCADLWDKNFMTNGQTFAKKTPKSLLFPVYFTFQFEIVTTLMIV